jgi:ATP-dependent Clp protease ATP-binding subunit ClpC
MPIDALIKQGGRDLADDIADGRVPDLSFRDLEADRVCDALDRQKSLLIVGPDGVGKSSLLYRVAARYHRPIYRFSTTDVMSGTKYLGEWETKISEILRATQANNAIIFLSDIWNLPYAGKTSNSERNLLDAVRPALQGGDVQILAECTPEVLRIIERTPKFIDLFERLHLAPLAPEEVDAILGRRAASAEVPLEPAVRSSLLKLTSRFLPSRPQPGPALALLDRAIAECQETGVPLDVGLIERVFCTISGLPPFVVSATETRRVEEVRQFFRDRIVGQQEAIEAVVESIALFKAGLQDPERPIGTFLFVGPTGVGKTEMARALAAFLFGSPARLLRFDLSELKDYHSFQQLIGDPRDATVPARLLDPVRAQPFQVVLLDEIEKAHQNVWDLLLPLLDEGRLTPPSGVAVDFRRTIVIATSNVGAEEANKSVGFGADADLQRSKRTRQALDQHFRPEFLNRFQHIVVFHALDAKQVQSVARQELVRVLQREGITGRNLAVDVDDAVIAKIVERGYDRRWGARGLKRELQQRIVLPLAVTIMEQGVEPGQLIKVRTDGGRIQISVVDTAPSIAARAERRPVKVASRTLDAEGWRAFAKELRDRIDGIGQGSGEAGWRAEIVRLEQVRDDPRFWQDPDAAARMLRDLDLNTRRAGRLDRLRERLDSIALEDRSRGAVELAADRLTRLEEAVEEARRDLVVFGPNGHWDALVEVSAVAGQLLARDWMVGQISRWAEHKHMIVDWLRDPIADESAFFAVRGPHAYGWLRAESGLHRVRKGDQTAAARIRVAPWDDRPAESAEILEHRALKKEGTFSGRLRSRLSLGPVTLQNGRTLQENRELAGEVLAAWLGAPPPSDEVLRRYDVDPPMIRDHRTGWQSQRPDALTPDRWSEMLLASVEGADH